MVYFGKKASGNIEALRQEIETLKQYVDTKSNEANTKINNSNIYKVFNLSQATYESWTIGSYRHNKFVFKANTINGDTSNLSFKLDSYQIKWESNYDIDKHVNHSISIQSNGDLVLIMSQVKSTTDYRSFYQRGKIRMKFNLNLGEW